MQKILNDRDKIMCGKSCNYCKYWDTVGDNIEDVGICTNFITEDNGRIYTEATDLCEDYTWNEGE